MHPVKEERRGSNPSSYVYNMHRQCSYNAFTLTAGSSCALIMMPNVKLHRPYIAS